jgi:hypothetical protein
LDAAIDATPGEVLGKGGEILKGTAKLVGHAASGYAIFTSFTQWSKDKTTANFLEFAVNSGGALLGPEMQIVTGISDLAGTTHAACQYMGPRIDQSVSNIRANAVQGII